MQDIPQVTGEGQITEFADPFASFCVQFGKVVVITGKHLIQATDKRNIYVVFCFVLFYMEEFLPSISTTISLEKRL